MKQGSKIPHYAEENLILDIGFAECRLSLLKQGIYSLHLMPMFKVVTILILNVTYAYTRSLITCN